MKIATPSHPTMSQSGTPLINKNPLKAPVQSLLYLILPLLLLLVQISACSTEAPDTGSGDVAPLEDTGTAEICPATLTPCTIPGTDSVTCVNIESDITNCGSCENRCAPGETCTAGECSEPPCPEGQTRCGTDGELGDDEDSGGVCHNLNNSREHCGTCGNTCPDGHLCTDGECTLTCPPAQQACDGVCTLIQSDWENCGSCGNTCEEDQVCDNSLCSPQPCQGDLINCDNGCINPMYNHMHCGGCGRTCPPSHVCENGQCTLWCPEGMEKCNNTCTWTEDDSFNCGSCNHRCPAGSVCQNGSCITQVRGIRLNRNTAGITPGGTLALTATLEPANATDTTVIWESSDPQVAQVNSEGLVTGQVAGQTTIYATTQDNGHQATCLVTVNQSVTGITLTPETLEISSNRTGTLTATVLPHDANDKLVRWSSSDTGTVVVDSQGTVMGISPGQCTITATTNNGEFSASATVNVSTVPTTGVTVSPGTINMNKQRQVTLTALVTPPNASNPKVTSVSSDPHIATVTKDTGVVTGVNRGVTHIAAITLDGGFTARAVVTVDVPVTFINLDQASITLERFSQKSLTAQVLPADATNAAITWTSSNPTVATVLTGSDPNPNDGIHQVSIEAHQVGQTTITATTVEGMYQVQCTVDVWETPVTGVQITPESAIMEKGDQVQLSATVFPSRATDKQVTWMSINPGVATVEEATGLVTAMDYGAATIQVTTVNGGYTATADILVVTPVTGVTVEPDSVLLEHINAEAFLTYTVIPPTATNQAVQWSSSNPEVFNVDQNGRVTLVSFPERFTGQIIVTTEDGWHQAVCQVETGYIPGTLEEPIYMDQLPENCQDYRDFGFDRDAWYKMSNGTRYCELSVPKLDCLSPTWGQVCAVVSPKTTAWNLHCPNWVTCPEGSHIAMNMDFKQSPCANYNTMSSGLGAYTHDVWYFDETSSRACSSGPNNWGNCSTSGCNSTSYGGNIGATYYRDGTNVTSGIRSTGRTDSSCTRGAICVRDW